MTCSKISEFQIIVNKLIFNYVDVGIYFYIIYKNIRLNNLSIKSTMSRLK